MDEEVRDGKVSLELPRKAAALDFGSSGRQKPALQEHTGHAGRKRQPPKTRLDVYWLGTGRPL